VSWVIADLEKALDPVNAVAAKEVVNELERQCEVTSAAANLPAQGPPGITELCIAHAPEQ
jgi:hypothetical protein